MSTWSTMPPEILLHIAEYLDRPSLTTSLSVCRAWHVIMLRRRWRTVRAQDWIEPQFRERLDSHMDQVQHLEWCNMRGLLRVSSSDRGLEFHNFCKTARLKPRDWQRHLQQLQGLPSSVWDQHAMARRLLRLGGNDRVDEPVEPAATGTCLTSLCIAVADRIDLELLKAIATLKHLRRLVLITNSISGLDNPQAWLELRQAWLSIYSTVRELFIWSVSPHIKQLVLPEARPPSSGYDISSPWSTTNFAQEHSQQLLELSQPYHREDRFFPHGWEEITFPQLRVLFLCGAVISPEVFLRLMARCPNLNHVLWPRFPEVPIPLQFANNNGIFDGVKNYHLGTSEFWSRLPHHLRDRLIGLSVSNVPMYSSPTSLIIRNLHGLRRINLQTSLITDGYLHVLGQSHPDLEEIEFGNWQGVGLSSEGIWEFLSRARKLKRFEAESAVLEIPSKLYNSVANQFSGTANEMGEKEGPSWWACRDLEVLMVGFHVAMGSLPGCRAMYALLSQLPKLRYLRLASNTYLMLNETSGLHQLATLRQLQYFVIDTATYGELTRNEVHWMLDHWPRLWRLHLSRQSIFQLQAIEEWAKERGRQHVIRLESRY